LSEIEEPVAAMDADARLRLALSFGDIAIWEMDIDRNEVTRSPNLNRLYGFPDDARPTIAEYMARYAPGEAERVARLNAEAEARGDTHVEHEIRHLWPDGTVKWLLVRAEAAPPSSDGRRRALGIVIDITRRKLVEERLAASERRLRLSQQAAGIASFELDVATGMLVASDNFWTIWGLAQRPAIHIDKLQDIVLEESQRVVTSETTRRDGTAEPRIELQIRRPDTGEVRWLARELEFVHDDAGRPVTMFGVVRDITAQKNAEDRQVLLTHELQHRIKNILATVSAIASQTLRSGDLETARDAFMQRIKALSEAHNLLTSTGWTDASLHSVLEAALAAHNLGGRVTIAGDDRRLTPRMALSLALAVNELATNAIKYGALSVPEGRVEVTWSADAGADGRELVWRWRETGGPAVSPPARRGFGSVLIERVLAADFGGTVALEFARSGLIAALRVPLAAWPDGGRAA
jgi:PAS domain S-box-containing protein